MQYLIPLLFLALSGVLSDTVDTTGIGNAGGDTVDTGNAGGDPPNTSNSGVGTVVTADIGTTVNPGNEEIAWGKEDDSKYCATLFGLCCQGAHDPNEVKPETRFSKKEIHCTEMRIQLGFVNVTDCPDLVNHKISCCQNYYLGMDPVSGQKIWVGNKCDDVEWVPGPDAGVGGEGVGEG